MLPGAPTEKWWWETNFFKCFFFSSILKVCNYCHLLLSSGRPLCIHLNHVERQLILSISSKHLKAKLYLIVTVDKSCEFKTGMRQNMIQVLCYVEREGGNDFRTRYSLTCFYPQTSYYCSSLPFQDAKSQHVVSGHVSYLKQKKKNYLLHVGRMDILV